MWALAFGVVAPKAAQGAAFEEDGGTDTGAIMNGEAFGVEDEACSHIIFKACAFLRVIQLYVIAV